MFSALETFVITELYKSTFTIPYHIATEPWLLVGLTDTKNMVKIGRAVPEICLQIDTQTHGWKEIHTETSIHITILHYPTRGGKNTK